MYFSENVREPLVLEKEDWNKTEWSVIEKIFNCKKNTERIKVNMNNIEYYTNPSSEAKKVYVVEILTVSTEGDGSSSGTAGVFSSEKSAIEFAQEIVESELSHYNNNKRVDEPVGDIRYYCCLDTDEGGFNEGYDYMTVIVHRMEITD